VLVFDDVNSLTNAKTRDEAAVTIGRVVKGYLVRKKYKFAKHGLDAYRQKLCMDVKEMFMAWLSQRALLQRKVSIIVFSK
jgi:hypothetical protein